MSGNSTLNPDNLPIHSDRSQEQGAGHGIGILGPSDTSDSGGDMNGQKHHRNKTYSRRQGDMDNAEEFFVISDEEESATDSHGTGERTYADTATGNLVDEDIDIDHIETLKPTE